MNLNAKQAVALRKMLVEGIDNARVQGRDSAAVELSERLAKLDRAYAR